MKKVNQTRERKLSLVCTPQTGKVLKYKSSVNDRLVHKSSTDTSHVRQQNCLKEEKKLLKGKENAKYVTRETGNLFRDSAEPRHDTDHDDRP